MNNPSLLPRRRLWVAAACILAAVGLGAGCSSRDPNWKETIPVTGVVTVDGQPVEGVSVKLVNSKGETGPDVVFPAAFTDTTGKFAISTYEQGDGAPPGDYAVIFTWPTLNTLSMQYEGDRLNGRYGDANGSEKRLTVASGAPIDMGKIDLTTK